MAGVGPVAQPVIAWPTPARAAAGRSSRAAPALASREETDALIILTVLDGNDLQTARRKVAALGDAQVQDDALRHTENRDPSTVGGIRAEAGAAPRPDPASTLRIEAEAVALHMDVQTGDTQVVLEMTRIHIGVQKADPAPPKKDPLVVDLDGSGPRTTGADGAVGFDLAADGESRPTSWVAGGTAFLAMDRNGDGRIDDGGELFGDQHGAMDGYEELRKFDADRNGAIDSRDPVYERLLLLGGSGEIRSMADAGVVSLGLDAGSAAGALTTGGDAILRRATAWTRDGRVLGTYALGLGRFEAFA